MILPAIPPVVRPTASPCPPYSRSGFRFFSCRQSNFRPLLRIATALRQATGVPDTLFLCGNSSFWPQFWLHKDLPSERRSTLPELSRRVTTRLGLSKPIFLSATVRADKGLNSSLERSISRDPGECVGSMNPRSPNFSSSTGEACGSTSPRTAPRVAPN